MGRTRLFDLERHFAFYGAYHSNPINIVKHMLFVWPIFFTSLVSLYFTPALYTPSFQIGLFPSGLPALNFGFLLAFIYGLFYVAFDKKARSLATLLCFLCWVGASLLANRLGYSLA
ncbi:2-hydroxy-palmitic acid dioxygenase mpo1-like [Castanea sativa]|uniref:2-hydroxy-palmitic acid dioxygenase mpo1-like n=1 Tax=Castanea sativa TaxID=21020 RepID=UPI003F65260E